jgi:serine/threonine protein phosphatase PrpC
MDLYQVSDVDTVLLCSDGLTEEVDDNAIHKRTMTNSTYKETAIKLIFISNDKSGSDNLSLVTEDV